MAVRDRIVDADQARNKYPVNFTAIANARGIIFHSHHAQKLLGKAFPNASLPPSTVVPLPRTLAQREERSGARSRLGIPQDAFVVCSFGFLDASKLNHRLLEAWRQSCLGQDALCHLIFVGENEGGDYGHALRSAIANSGASNRIRITGFTSAVDYRGFLSAADVGVQLRTQSRGETSAAVLDCMNYGVPVIVNAHAAMAELDANTVCMISDEFHDQELINALETLRRDAVKRRRYGVAAADYMSHSRRPEQTAEAYRSALTQCEKSTRISAAWLARTIAAKTEIPIEDPVLPLLAQSIATTFPGRCAAPKIWIDVTGTYGGRLRTGIERVAASLTSALMEVAPPEFHIEPVCLRQAGSVWRHVSVPSFAMDSLGCPGKVFSEAFVSPAPGDIVLALDLAGGAFTQAVRAGLFAEYRARGVQTFAMVHDLLPIAMPQVFPPGADIAHREWVESVSSLDGAICVSQAVAEDLHKWLQANTEQEVAQRRLRICVSHHGADFLPSLRTTGLPPGASSVLRSMASRPTFVMVGTIEPRKGYLQVIDAFNCMWRNGYDVGLAIVGAEGWSHLPKEMRRDIPETVQRIRGNVEFNRRLFWCDGISDEYLECVYGASRCLIAASYGEGFGLPLIEAARHHLPIIARDIPVFREVAGDHAFYFSGTAPEAFATACVEWMKLYEANNHPRSEGLRFRTWRDSAATLLSILRGATQNKSRSGETYIGQCDWGYQGLVVGHSEVPS
jgi:glycosyltransferase involved in cell wall biosynthesis